MERYGDEGREQIDRKKQGDKDPEVEKTFELYM